MREKKTDCDRNQASNRKSICTHVIRLRAALLSGMRVWWWWWCAVIAVAFDLIDECCFFYAYDSHPVFASFFCSSLYYCNFFSALISPTTSHIGFFFSLIIIICPLRRHSRLFAVNGVMFVRWNFKHNIYNINRGVAFFSCVYFTEHFVGTTFFISICFLSDEIFLRLRVRAIGTLFFLLWSRSFGSISKLWIIAHKIICFRVWYTVIQLLSTLWLCRPHAQLLKMHYIIFVSYA